MKKHNYFHADTYRPHDRDVFVDVFLCHECDLHKKSEKRSFVIHGWRNPKDKRENVIFPYDKRFKRDKEY